MRIQGLTPRVDPAGKMNRRTEEPARRCLSTLYYSTSRPRVLTRCVTLRGSAPAQKEAGIHQRVPPEVSQPAPRPGLVGQNRLGNLGVHPPACRTRGPDAGFSLKGWLRSAHDARCPPLRSSVHGHGAGPRSSTGRAVQYHHDTVPPAACMMPGRACQQSCEPIQHTACAEAADQWYVGPTDVLRGPAIKEQPESIAMRQQPPHWLSAPGSEQEGWIRYSKEIGFCTSVL